jgi:hypothetical protein
MSTFRFPVVRTKAPAWNKGRIVGQKRPLLPKHVWAIRVRLEIAQNSGDLALFNMGIDYKVRGCNLVWLRVRDVFVSGHMKERALVMQSKRNGPSSSRSRSRPAKPCSDGSQARRCSAATICGQAGFTAARIFQRGSMHASCAVG